MIEEPDSNLCSCCGSEPRNLKVYSRYNQISDLCTDCWELEGTIYAIVQRMNTAEVDSAEYLMAESQLDELHNTRPFAEILIEDLKYS